MHSKKEKIKNHQSQPLHKKHDFPSFIIHVYLFILLLLVLFLLWLIFLSVLSFSQVCWFSYVANISASSISASAS